LAALCLIGAVLAACTSDKVDTDFLRPGYLGSLIDRPPPPIVVGRGGPSGDLLASPVAPLLPPDAVDQVVADVLRNWLTPIEREALAGASQQAAILPTGSIVPWQAVDGTGAVTARGTAVPLADVFRSGHGLVCRIVRQTVDKGGAAHIQQASLCRADEGDGLFVWRVAKIDGP
jgi:surface antigen